jgi:Mn2+/Fe2+ NRAMP family transporter
VRWSAPPVLRRILTRTVALVPGMVVAAVQGQRGVDGLLVASQVVLAFCLPFVCLPLLVLTSRKEVMSVRKEHRELVEEQSREVHRSTQGQDEMVNFANGVVSQAFGWLFLLVLIVANVYVLVELARGKT